MSASDTHIFVLTYPKAPKSLNAGGAGSRRHWAVGYREKKQWEGLYAVLLLASKVPTGMLHCQAEAIVRWKTRVRRDSTNYIASVVKPLGDALVKGGWLPDDTDAFFTFAGLSFEYPSEWPFPDPRVKAEIVIRLQARYPEPQQPSHEPPDAG